MILDAIVFGIVLGLLFSLANTFGEGLSVLVVLGGLFGYLIFSLWFWSRGQTAGKWLMNIRAVDKRNGSDPGFGRMLIRETIGKFISGCFLGLGWFWAIWDKDAQAWHDKIAGTVVLRGRGESSRALAFIGLVGASLCFAVVFAHTDLASSFSHKDQAPSRSVTIVDGPAYLGSNQPAFKPSQQQATPQVPIEESQADQQPTQ